MTKYPIGFQKITNYVSERTSADIKERETDFPRKSVVYVYFPHRGTGWSYYNDSFNLKVGDFVYVEGKLEGYRGVVTEINYAFKIKLSDYKKVIAHADTDVQGDLYLAGSHVISFDRHAIPFSKILPWFKAPENDEEYVSGNDDANAFPLDDLSKMKIHPYVAERGERYYRDNNVSYLELDGSRGRAIVEGSAHYEIEFDYIAGEISNLKCSCFCTDACKHTFAAILQLRETLALIAENYNAEHDGYFAIISKGVFVNTVMNKQVSGKIRLGV